LKIEASKDAQHWQAIVRKYADEYLRPGWNVTKPYRIIASTTLFLLGACGGDSIMGEGSDNVVNIYNWADYIGPDTIERFEAETGIKVNYDTYAASATVDVKLLTGNSGYDVVIHSNVLSSRLVEVGVYQKLDMSLLPNLKNLDPETMQRIDVYPTVKGYNIPYHWGSTGFSYNEEMIRERLPDQSMDTSAVLFDPEILAKLADCGVSFLDGTTSLIPMALAYLGLDPNAIDEKSLQQVQDLLAEVRPYVRYFSNDKFITDMPNKELCISMSWSGDYATAAKRAEEVGIDIDMRYTVPVEGASLWVDGIYIPSDARHVDNAYTFMNYLLRADVAADIAVEVDYANANAASWAFLSEEKLNDPAIYPDEEIWRRMFVVEMAEPAEERNRTRTLARVKSGL
jgi:putrescine transport system substrate-binding protein